ncbi:MAG: glycosyltransferase [Bacteroidota bacterium]
MLFVTALAPYRIYPAKMGGQKGIAFFYRFFSKHCNVTLVSTNNNQPPDDFSGNFLSILPNSKLRYFNPLIFFTIKKIIKKTKSTHLIIEHPYYGWLGYLLKKSLKVKLVVHSHNIESMRFKTMGKWWWKIMYTYEKWTHQIADISFFISDEDKTFAVNNFKLVPKKCTTITYGFDVKNAPTTEEKEESKKHICKAHQIPFIHKILFFNGTLDYAPNLNALMCILNDINPVLLNSEIDYTIIICGKNLPDQLHELKQYKDQNIIYAGFVDDITVYFKGADIFINPVIDGGGIKTKLVEALGYDTFCISSKSGAIGVPSDITQGKLIVIENNDCVSFANAIIHGKEQNKISDRYFDYFYWNNIAEKASKSLSELI